MTTSEKKIKKTSSNLREQPEEVKESKGDLRQWLDDLYGNVLKDDEIRQIYDNVKFVGFNRDEILEQLSKIFKDTKLMSEVIIACAVRGPVAASQLKLSNGRTIASYGVAPNGGRRSKTLTCGKITAATADLAAFYLKKTPVPKRLNNLDCPAWLQFPSAGSLPLSQLQRNQHLEFAVEFSKQIDKRVGGGFNQQIYDQMSSNTYCDERVRSFLFG
jgi:hypothetical protein